MLLVGARDYYGAITHASLRLDFLYEANVYYTTGTVATCLNHPRQGKTQLFRRNMTLPDLKSIFQNPRVHSGVGYQMIRKNMTWIPIGRSRTTYNIQPEEECDLTRRCRYVCYATNLCDDEEMERIVSFCRLWKFLEFPNNANIVMSRSNRREGSNCTLCDMLLVVARDYYGARTYVETYGDGNQAHGETRARCSCKSGDRYRKNFREPLNQARCLILSLGDPVRFQVLFWFIGRFTFMALDENGTSFRIREDIVNVHRDYTAQFYPRGLEVC